MNLGSESKPAAVSRRQLLGSGVALGSAALLGACNQQRAPQTQQGKDAQQGQVAGDQYPEEAARALNETLKWPETMVDEPASPVELTVSHAWDSTFIVRQKQFDTFFTERHPNIKVTYENTPFAEYQRKYVTAAAGGSLPDLMYIQFAFGQVFIRQGVFRSLAPYLDRQTDFNLDDFTKPSTTPFYSNNELYGIPYDCGPLMLYYNRDLLTAAGVDEPTDDWTFDDLKAAALEVYKSNTKVWGLSAGPSPTNAAVGPPYLHPFDARFANEDQTACLIDQPAAIEAMSYWHELRTAKAVPTPAQIAAVQPDPFTVGRAGFHLAGTWATPALQDLASFDWAIALWPSGPKQRSTAAVGSAYAITQNSKNPDAAWIYLNEYLSEAGQNFMWASTGRGSPARSSAWKYYTESEFAPEGSDKILPALEQYGSGDVLYLPQTTKALDTAQPIWDRVLAGSLELEPGLREVAKAMTPILADNAS